jgi:membrane protease YdiL (CAAX protease family)
MGFSPPRDMRTPWWVAAVFYGVMFGIAALWRFLGNGSFVLRPAFPRHSVVVETALVAGLAGLEVLLLTVGSGLSRRIRSFERGLARVIGELSPAQALFLAALSAIGEESFFRGALQPAIGFWPATILFAAAHVPLRKELALWPLYALVVGIVLGVLRSLSGDVWSAVVAHFLVNAVGLLSISFRGGGVGTDAS